MSQTQMTLPATFAHKTLGWRRLLLILTLVIMVSGGLWWAKETQLLDSLLSSNTSTSATINPTSASNPTSISNLASTEQRATNEAQVSTNAVTPTTNAVGANSDATNKPQTTVSAADSALQAATASLAAASTTDDVASAPHSLVAIAGIDGVQLWNAEGQRLTTLDTGTRLQATARTDDGQWLTVEADSAAGWAQAAQVVAFDLADLPVTTAPAPVATASTQAMLATVSTASHTKESVFTMVETPPAATATTQAAVPTANAASAAVTAVVATSGANLNVRTGPATNYALVTKVANGTSVTVLGRDESSTWLQVQLSTEAAEIGWVVTKYIQAASSIDALPVVTAVTD